ncbi:MAG: TrkA family potassium uptake protein [Eubacteriales bacterium]|nr:TrkA family potassium uptake protein [Eubacteriales bacterium]
MKKSFAVLGLGKFGESIAKELTDAGCEVLAVDTNRERVQNLSDIVTYAVTADVCDTETMRSLGISNMDAVVVAITNNLNASILATIFAKEAGVPYVIAKSNDEIHTKVLEKVGADKVIIPEHESGVRIAHRLVSGNVLDFFELSQRIRMVEISIKPEWIGKSLRNLDLRQKHKINIIAIRQKGEIILNPDPDEELAEDITMLVIVDKEDLHRLF